MVPLRAATLILYLTELSSIATFCCTRLMRKTTSAGLESNTLKPDAFNSLGNSMPNCFDTAMQLLKCEQFPNRNASDKKL